MKGPTSRLLSIAASLVLALSAATCRMEDAPGGGGGSAPADPGLIHARDITPGQGFTMSPLWSPDGRWIALTTEGYRGLMLVDPDSGISVKVTDDPAAGTKPAWSPDGKRLAYLVSRVETGKALKALAVYDVDRGEEKVLTDFQADLGFPLFSQDGKFLLLTMCGRLVKIDLLRGGMTEVSGPTPARWVQAAEEAGMVVFDEGREIASVEMDDGTRTVLFSGDGFFNPILSPDGQKVLVYESRGTEGHVWVSGLKGEEKRDLGPGYGAKFHPDGAWIVLEELENDSLRFTAGDLWAVSTADGRRVRLTDTVETIEMYPDFSPDGTKIAFTDGATGRVFVADVVFGREGEGVP